MSNDISGNNLSHTSIVIPEDCIFGPGIENQNNGGGKGGSTCFQNDSI